MLLDPAINFSSVSEPPVYFGLFSDLQSNDSLSFFQTQRPWKAEYANFAESQIYLTPEDQARLDALKRWLPDILSDIQAQSSIPLVEALSLGLPVIASKHCGEAVKHGRNGWILEDLEPETIAAAIRRATTEKLPDVRPPEFSMDDLAEALMK